MEPRTTPIASRALSEKGHFVQVLCAEGWDRGRHHWNGYVDETYNGIAVRRLLLNWAKAPDPNRYLYDNPVHLKPSSPSIATFQWITLVANSLVRRRVSLKD